jgi:hypothetical protein
MKHTNYFFSGFKSIRKNLYIFIPLIVVFCMAMATADSNWEDIQKLKANYLSQSAQHAMEQQKTSQSSAVPIALAENALAFGDLKVTAMPEGSFSVEMNASPKVGNRDPAERIQIRLPQPMDMLTGYSGLAVFVESESGTSPEVRTGIRLMSPDGQKTEILPVLPVLSAWGDALHELYFDWGSLNYDKAGEVAAVLQNVTQIEFTFASARRAPERGPSSKALPARMKISQLRLVDYLQGSYDPSRQSLKFDTNAGKWVHNGQYDFTLQHRTQEVTGIVATFGKEPGIKSAISSIDMAARTQCWDGSFLDGRRGAVTVASGEYTFGFTIYGLLQGYKQLEKIKHHSLDEIITIGPLKMSRRESYQRMFYRAAMARSAATPANYRDDIIGGNTLISGANRVLGYAIAMRMVADILINPEWKKQIMDIFFPFMEEIAEAQGKFSGGFPLLGEGNRYQGKGIHYDAGYIRTHMDWLVIGVIQTGDPLLVEILRKYQTVFEAAMNEHGVGILRMISERGQGTSPVRLILPDATFQVGLKYKLPIIAQWGYNCSQLSWIDTPPRNHFSSSANARGYSLGAHYSILLDDMQDQGVPKDLGYLFPRQFPLWSTHIFSKDGKMLRSSVMIFNPDGTQVSDYRIDVGEYPITVGIPIMIKSDGRVTAIAKKLNGWPNLLTERAPIKLTGDIAAKGKVGKTIKVKLDKETTFAVTGPKTMLPTELGGEKIPFLAEFVLIPEKPGQIVEITVLKGTIPYAYTLEIRD